MILWLIPRQWRVKLIGHRAIIYAVDLAAILLLLFVVFCSGFRYFEQKSWGEAAWQFWQTVTTVGYGDGPAKTAGGRLVTIAVLTTGIMVVGASFATALDIFTEKKERRLHGMSVSSQAKGYVVINYPGTSQFLRFLEEIRYVEPGADICVVDNNLESLPAVVQAQSEVLFINGSTIHRETYERAAIAKSKAVIVFPVSDNDSADGQTASIVTQLCKYLQGSKTRVLYLLVNDQNHQLFDHLPATPINGHLDLLATVQECQDPHTSRIIAQLLSNTVGANPHTVALSPRLHGYSWKELSIAVLMMGVQCNLLGVIKVDGQVESCPPLDYRLQPGDSLSVIAFNGFDWQSAQDQVLRSLNKSAA